VSSNLTAGNKTRKFLFFDTETTGKADFRAPCYAPQQPRLVQLAALLTDDAGDELGSVNLIIKPSGFEIPVEATAVHGISTQAASLSGVALHHALGLFVALAEQADALVAHNIQFDELVMASEAHRFDYMIPHRITFCTMQRMTPICRLPGKYGDFKWPNLQEAHRHCFRHEFVDAHDALADVRACKAVFFWLKQNHPEAWI
jgi:DNA polymerase III epsilon subunit-like protein